jgi:predicted MPP superfamily phosphohydrolase
MMPVSIRFILVRLIILALLVGSQLYLFLRGDRALRRSRLSPRRKRLLRLGLAGFFASMVVVYLSFLARGAPLQHASPLVLYGFVYPAAIWSFGSIFSCLFLLLADLIGWGAALIRPNDTASGPPSEEAADPSRRRFVQTGLSALAAAPVLISGYGASYESIWYRIEEVSLPLAGHRPSEAPLRVVQVSDIHSGLFMTPARMRRCAEAVQQLQPDLFVLTGDFISNSIAYLAPCVKEMARVRARYGSFAVLGNHEHWYGEPDEIIAVFEAAGIVVLQNTHRVLETDRGPLALAGIDDLRFGKPDLDQALEGLDPAHPTILLSHRPEIFPQAADRNIALTLSGHYHGGQIKVSLAGLEFSLARLMTPYPEGLYQLGESHLYVNRGLGTTGTPVRLNVPPEITLFHLT